MSEIDKLKKTIKVVEAKKKKIVSLNDEINKEVLGIKDSLLDTSIIDISLTHCQLYFILTVFSDSVKDDNLCNVLNISLVMTIGGTKEDSIQPQIRSELNSLVYKEALNLLDEKLAIKKYHINKREYSSLKDETISDFIMRMGLDIYDNLEVNIIKNKEELKSLQKNKKLLEKFKNVFSGNLYEFDKIVSVLDREETSFELRSQILYKEKVEDVIDSLIEKKSRGEMLSLSKKLYNKNNEVCKVKI